MNHYTLIQKHREKKMSNKFKEKSVDDFNKMCSVVCDPKIPTVGFAEGSNFQDMIVQFGAEIAGIDDPELKYKSVIVNHALNTTGNKTQTFEADGIKLRYHDLLDYKNDFMSGKVRLIFYTPKIWMSQFMDEVLKAINEYNNDNYNGWENFWFGVGDFLAGTPLRPIIGWIPNPAYRKNSVVCSQLAILIYKYIPEIYNTVLAGQDITHMQPETLLILIIKYFNFIYDSEDVIK
jgi:hypothetical protein